MNKQAASCLLFLLAMNVPSLFGQHLNLDLKASEGEPTEPFVTMVPEGAQWTVTASKLPPLKESGQAITPDDPDGREAAFPDWMVRRISNAYASGVRRITIEHGNGSQLQMYLTDSVLAYQLSRSNRVRVQRVQDPFFNTFQTRSRHFDEVEWVGAKFYLGNTIYNGRVCHVYRQYHPRERRLSIDAVNDVGLQLPESAEGVPLAHAGGNARIMRTVLIDSKTRLPVLRDEEDAIWKYVFQDVKASFEVPPAFAQAIQEYSQSIVDLKQKYNAPQ